MNNIAVLEGVVFHNEGRLELRTFMRDETGKLAPVSHFIEHGFSRLPPSEHTYRIYAEVRSKKEGLFFYATGYVEV